MYANSGENDEFLMRYSGAGVWWRHLVKIASVRSFFTTSQFYKKKNGGKAMLQSYFVRNSNDRFEVTQVEDDWLIVNLNDFSITRLDQLAGLCFSMLTEAQSLDMLVESVLSNYAWHEDFEGLKATVCERVEVLLSHNLIYYVH